ncbi:MAG: RrF2 family transcriptional regulator [Clostridiales bacterium]|jgi:Rrf2 family protein|nr:RrF2 family transcriptional regulator [Clostridiales bacterium]
MMVSTKGRYALRVMVDLTEHNTGAYIPLKDIAERQNISRKYLESIMVILSKAGFVDSLQGKSGGYRLNRHPKEYTVGGILKLTEGALVPVACLEPGGQKCDRSDYCKTLPLWVELDRLINGYLEGITIEDLTENNLNEKYLI